MTATNITIQGTPYRHWWTLLVLGLLSIVAGIVVLVWPGSGVVAIALIVGVLLIVHGVGELSWAMREPKGTRGRAWLVILGIVDVIAGAFAVAWPDITALALALVIGIYLIIDAVPMLAFAFSAHPRAREHRVAFVAIAVGVLLVGIVSVVWPGITILAVALLFGAMLLWRGLFMTYAALAIRRTRCAAEGTG